MTISLIDSFVNNHINGIKNLHKFFIKDKSVKFETLMPELMVAINTSYAEFLSKQQDLSLLDSHLFYAVNAYYKNNALESDDKNYYVCPGCSFLKKTSILEDYNSYLKCKECEESSKNIKDPIYISLYNAFMNHSKDGYKCINCDRFIPTSHLKNNNISCPYLDCNFYGAASLLKSMKHPLIRIKKDCKTSQPVNVNKNDNPSNIDNLRRIIFEQSNNVLYVSSNFTSKHKTLIYKAINNLLDKDPVLLFNYLIKNSRSGGFQHKIFQEYVSLLEKELPISFKKYGKVYKINNLLDSNLCIFDGISEFDSIISDKLDVKNKTKEFYIGGRKGAYAEPYFIGKLLSVIDKDTNLSLLDNVIEYSFSKIKFKNVSPAINVKVTHLRIAPHYQMGAMVHINRIRKKIVDDYKKEYNE